MILSEATTVEEAITQLYEAMKRDATLWIDNDHISGYTDSADPEHEEEEVLSCHPDLLLQALFKMLGLKHERV